MLHTPLESFLERRHEIAASLRLCCGEYRVPASRPAQRGYRLLDLRIPINHRLVVSHGDGSLLREKRLRRAPPNLVCRLRIDSSRGRQRVDAGLNASIGSSEEDQAFRSHVASNSTAD